ncbi:MAG: class III signal peptide-containing protein [Candidatus Diapherotrites archaeon]|nr:class III signal peptide-containing protein [Candidatus Diapherotrites archaeon]
MKRGQTSVEYLLLTAGVLLTAVVAGQYVVTSGVHVQHATNVEANKLMTIHDTIPPTTTLMCNGTSCFTKYNKSVTISFVCQDNLQGTGCKETYYQINRGKWQKCPQPSGCKDVYTLAKPSSRPATYTINFYSVDMNGNVEKTQTVTITIGSSFSATGAASISYSPQFPKPGDSVQVTATASTKIRDVNIEISNGGSIVKSKVCGDMIGGQKCAIAFTPATQGQYTVRVWATDGFGIRGLAGQADINVDGTAPTITFNAPDRCAWYNKDFTVSVTANDGPNPGSSLMKQWKYDAYDSKSNHTSGWLSISRPVQNTTKSFGVKVGPSAWCSVQGPNTCNVQVQFEDRAKNIGTATQKYSIDYNAPTVRATIPEEGWVNHEISIPIECTDIPSNGSGCKAIYWTFVDKGQSCPSESDTTAWQKKTFSSNGCPYQWPHTATADANLNCTLCAKDLCYYAEDGAGNKTAVKRTTLKATNGVNPGTSYAIDKIPPSCQIDLTSQPQVVNGSYSGTDWRMGGIGGYKYDIICSDQSNGSGLKDVKISLANPQCGGCKLSCTMESDIRTLSEWATGGGETGSTATSAEFAVSPTPNAVAFHCTVDATAGSTCVASGLQVTATDWAGNSKTSNGGSTMKLDAKEPQVNIRLVTTNPSSPVCGLWYKSFTITTTGTDDQATTCNSGVFYYQAFTTNGAASPAIQQFPPTATKTIKPITITAKGYEGQVCVRTDFHDAVRNANWTGEICKMLDNKAPDVRIYAPSTAYVGSPIMVSAYASDKGSGLAGLSILPDIGFVGGGCGAHSLEKSGEWTPTCRDAVDGQMSFRAIASDNLGNTGSASTTIDVRCRTNKDCSCLNAITCNGNAAEYWEGTCSGICRKMLKGRFDCSEIPIESTISCKCNQDENTCTETITCYKGACANGTGCIYEEYYTGSVTINGNRCNVPLRCPE